MVWLVPGPQLPVVLSPLQVDLPLIICQLQVRGLPRAGHSGNRGDNKVTFLGTPPRVAWDPLGTFSSPYLHGQWQQDGHGAGGAP